GQSSQSHPHYRSVPPRHHFQRRPGRLWRWLGRERETPPHRAGTALLKIQGRPEKAAPVTDFDAAYLFGGLEPDGGLFLFGSGLVAGLLVPVLLDGLVVVLSGGVEPVLAPRPLTVRRSFTLRL